MPIRPCTCLAVHCDVCGTPLEDHETGGILHFTTRDAALTGARRAAWPVASDRLICPIEDDPHQAAFDELLPPAPTTVPDGQIDIGDADPPA